MDKELYCPICGEPTSKYMGNPRKDRLCKKHAKELKEDKIFSDENEKVWYSVNEAKIINKDFIFLDLPTSGFNKCILCGKETNGYAYCKKCYKEHTFNELIYILNNPPITYETLPTTGFETCILCGKESNGYAYCKDCFYKFNQKEKLDNLNYFTAYNVNILSLDEEDENMDEDEDFEEDNEPEEEILEIIEEQKNNVIIINQENKSKCITCGKQTDGFLFCPQCYKKYKNKELLFKITNCSSVELLDEDYEGKYTCKDGHIVKSKSERDIDNFLFENDIQHAYEKELPYGAKENEILHPDFFLKDYLGKGKHVYIEHWGYNENNIQYTKTKKFKMPIYEKLNITLICTYEKTDSGKIDSVLERKLNKNFIKENEINYKEE